MAFANGETVLPILPAGDLAAHGDNYPLFGILTDAGGPFDVQWRNGNNTVVTAATSLDRIVSPSGATFKLGDWVRPIAGMLPGNVAQRYEGRVVAVHQRDNAGQGVLSPVKVVVRDKTGQYYETNQTNLEVVPSR